MRIIEYCTYVIKTALEMALSCALAHPSDGSVRSSLVLKGRASRVAQSLAGVFFFFFLGGLVGGRRTKAESQDSNFSSNGRQEETFPFRAV